MFLRIAALAILSLAFLACPSRAEPVSLLTNGDYADGFTGWNSHGGAPLEAEVIDANVGGFTRALRVTTRSGGPAGQPWDMGIDQAPDAFLNKGDRLVLTLWLRSPEGCRVMPYLELARDPWPKSLSETLTLTPDWTEYTIAGECLDAYAPGEYRFGIHLGFDDGTVEMAGLKLEDLDLDSARFAAATPENPVSLIENGDFAPPLSGSWVGVNGESLTAEPIETGHADLPRALRLTSAPPEGGAPWSVGFGQRTSAAVRPGDVIYFRAWLRSPDNCRVAFILERSAPPNDKLINQAVLLTGEWTEYRFAGVSPVGFRPGDAQAKLFLGYGPGVVEIADMRVESHGKANLGSFDQTIDFWQGRPHADDWRGPALERIEAIRKGDLTVHVENAAGEPVEGATVRIEQTRHHFRFGSAVPAARLLDTTNPDNARFREEVERLFNTITFENDLKWAAAREGQLAMVDQAIEWCADRGIEVRGHCLLWGDYQHLPAPLRDLRGDALRTACDEHIAEYAAHMAGKVYLWDVVNEAATNTALWDEIGWDRFPEAFRLAREADPAALLCYNDYGILHDNSPAQRDAAAKRIEDLLAADAPVDVLGLQAHMGLPFTPMDRVLANLDRWAGFDKDLEITEFDLGCTDDAAHAEYVRDFLIAAFSHPSVKAFIQWGFWEGSHWRAGDGGAMFRRDWSKRPAQEEYERLVLGDWWTREEARTGPDGAVRTRAFYGTHTVTVSHGGGEAAATVTFAPGETGEVTVRLQ